MLGFLIRDCHLNSDSDSRSQFDYSLCTLSSGLTTVKRQYSQREEAGEEPLEGRFLLRY